MKNGQGSQERFGGDSGEGQPPDHSVHQLLSVMDYGTCGGGDQALCGVSREDCREPTNADWLCGKHHLLTLGRLVEGGNVNTWQVPFI